MAKAAKKTRVKSPGLPLHVKVFITESLACFETHSEIIRLVKENFGLTVTYQALQHYDPTKVNGKQLAPEFKEIFEKRREEFRKNTDSIPVANKAFRLQELNKLYRRASEKNNVPLAANILEQASKEAGDAFTNKHKHEVTGKDGAPIAQSITTSDPVEAARIYAEMIGDKKGS